jgi:hypothetical protein
MSLESVAISLKNCFSCGQAYVACSRAKSIEGLYIDAFDISSIKADPLVSSLFPLFHIFFINVYFYFLFSCCDAMA